jgi:hypothetical protein
MANRIPVPFVGGSYEGVVSVINPQRAINLYAILEKEGGKVPLYMVQTSGLKNLGQASGEGRGAIEVNGTAYAVIGNKFYRVSAAGVCTELGTLGTSSGFLQIESNGVDIVMIDSSTGYVYDFATFSAIADADFPSPSSLTYQDGYYVVGIKGSNSFAISALLDGKTWDALDFSSADGEADNLVAAKSDHRELWLMCEHRGEVWWNSGNADFPFERIQGVSMTTGLGAVRSLARCDNTLFWLDENFQVRRASNKYDPLIVSSRQMEYQISKYAIKSDAVGLSYIENGQTFYTLIFPTDGKVWEYNAATLIWHERTSGSLDSRWRANAFVKAYGKNIFFDYENGNVYELDHSTFTDNADTVKRTRRTVIVNEKHLNITIYQLEIEFKPGVGTDDIEDPQVMLRYSKDGGRTWSNELWRSIGKVGQYRNRAIWNRLGSSRDWCFELTMTDAVELVIIGAWADASLGNS